MASNVVHFPHPSKRPSEIQRLEAIDAAGREVGRRMSAPNKKIPYAERKVIATRLNEEIERSDIAPGVLSERAGLRDGPRELDKMRWRPGNKEDKELLAHSARYVDVIKALAKLSDQSPNVLLDRITVGTSLHRLRSAGGLDDIEKTLLALENAAIEADGTLGLLGQFRQTLRLKCEGFARADLNDWPFYPLWAGDIPDGDEALTDEMRAQKQARWDERLRGERGFWFGGGDSYADGPNLDTLGYLPHAYLGILADWQDLEDYDWENSKRSHYKLKLREAWAPEYERIPTAVYIDGRLPEVANTGEAVCGAPYSVHDIPHSWLILYPNLRMTEMVPVLLTLNADLGTIIELVDERKLIELQHIELIGKHPLAYDGVIELLAPPQGEKSLAERWIETGRWFRENPFLKAETRRSAARERRDRLFAQEASDEQP